MSAPAAVVVAPCCPVPRCALLPCCAPQVAGWEDRGLGGVSGEADATAQQLASDLEAFESVDELETMGALALALAVQLLFGALMMQAL